MIAKETIQAYWNNGLKTLPTKVDKCPDVEVTWKGGISDIEKYNNAYGIGVICGAISGNLECWDFDNHQQDAKQNLSNFIAQIKDLHDKYKFPIESTMNGGFHLLFRCDFIQGNQKLAQKPKQENGKWKPDTIIETRGENGYFVSAPTPGYTVIRNSILQIPKITTEERARMIEVARSFNEWTDLVVNEFESGNKPGDVFNETTEAIDQMRSCLQSHGWTDLGGNKWRREGKKDGISATLGKVAPNVFYCFTSNGFPFVEMKGYKPFQVIGLLDYNGDFKKFAGELAEKYKLDRPKKEYKKEDKPIEINELKALLKKSFIDLDIPVAKPPIILKIREFNNGYLYDNRLFTLGNFSAITGKSKSKKTFLTSIFLAAAVKRDLVYNKIGGQSVGSKENVILFDTEQSNYDAFVTAKRVEKLAGNNDVFSAFALREYTPKQRCQIIEYALETNKDYIGYVVIDGIADLATAINDEDEATRVVGLLMKWTKLYNIHITTCIHQNKNDNYATGHIGSSILKKAEAIISVTKDDKEMGRSQVECDMIRGTHDFKPFNIDIDETGIPIISDNLNIAQYEIKENNF
jgi:KaiC/GvpD/RAD55 family RecA-like ATPase